MNRTHAYILAILLGVSVPALVASARPQEKLLEASVEAFAEDLSLPANESGVITVRGCPACSAQTLYFAKERVLILAGRPVSLKEMTDALRRDGKSTVTVFFRRTDQQVTRIVLAMSVQPADAAQ